MGSPQADRIQALMERLIEQNDKLIELLEAAPAKRTKKAKPFLTNEEQTQIYHDYGARFQGDASAIDTHIATALDHDAAKKAGNSGSWNLYVRQWLNKQVKNLPSRPVLATSSSAYIPRNGVVEGPIARRIAAQQNGGLHD